jgi:antitoxin HicB
MHARYTVQIVRQPMGETGFLVTCHDIPGVITEGATEAEAEVQARDALLTMIELMMDLDRPVPLPSAGQGTVIDLGTLVAAKIALHNLRLEAGLNRAQLAERIGGSPSQAARNLSVRHNSRMDQIDRALAVLGYHAEIAVMRGAAE